KERQYKILVRIDSLVSMEYDYYRDMNPGPDYGHAGVIKEIDKTFAEGKITNTNYIASLYAMKAKALQKLHEEEIDSYLDYEIEEYKDDSTFKSNMKPVLDEIFSLYEKSVSTCEYCAPANILQRYEFERDYDYYESKSKADLEILKKYGYKKERIGIPLGITYIKAPKNEYIGIEISPVGFLDPRYKMKNLNKETGKKEVVASSLIPVNYQAFTCGFNKNITRQGYEVWFSAGQVTSPLMINAIKFGFTENYISNERVHWFYRPELGLGWGIFSVNCGYNMVFKKEFRREDNKWFVTARIAMPIIRAFD
ncbi:MAG TPA: hypothetical protein VGF30_00715, partial [Bacteroidia bacterium]